MSHKFIKPQTLKRRAIAQYHNTSKIIIMAIALMLSMIAFSAAAQEGPEQLISLLRKQVSMFFLRNTLDVVHRGNGCHVNYAVVSFKVKPGSYLLDSINLESNLPEENQAKIAQMLPTVQVDWKLLAGEGGLDGKVVRMPFLIRNSARKCEKNGQIPPAEVSQLMTSMIGSQEKANKLFGQSVFLPLDEIIITTVGG